MSVADTSVDNPKKLSPELIEIFTELFRCVGAEFSEEAVAKPDWFRAHSWNIKQEYKFRRWLVNYIRDHRKALFGRVVPMSLVKSYIPYFMLNYSWKINYDDKPVDKPVHTESTFSSDQISWTRGMEDL